MRLIIENESSFNLPEDLLRLAADMAQEAEGLTLDCCIQLSITDDEGIREINLDQRGIDKATDVLSFPAVSYPKGMTASGAAELLRRNGIPICGLVMRVMLLSQWSAPALRLKSTATPMIGNCAIRWHTGCFICLDMIT